MREQAYRHIQGLIASGVLKGGSALSELMLAKELGTSRTPIREAIGQLVAEGLLEQTPIGTTLVVQLRRQDISELYELREALEIFAIEKTAASHLSAVDQERLQKLVDELLVLFNELKASGNPTLDFEQMNRFLASDFAFHSLLIGMARNGRIQRILNDMRLLIRIFSIQRKGHTLPVLNNIYNQHQQVLNAVISGDAHLARNVLSTHIRSSLKERLDEFDFWRREESLEAILPAFVWSAR